tara:strand:- start:284 stop:436 length:153 start_codon:yes stop_codon:yes gene_type:complete
MAKYEVEYKMKHQSRQKIIVNASGTQAARETVKSMMGPNCENITGCQMVK